MMMTSSKCRPRNSAGRFWVTVSPYQIRQLPFATDPEKSYCGSSTSFGQRSGGLSVPALSCQRSLQDYSVYRTAFVPRRNQKLARPAFAPFPALLSVQQLSALAMFFVIAYWDQLSTSVVMSTVRC